MTPASSEKVARSFYSVHLSIDFRAVDPKNTAVYVIAIPSSRHSLRPTASYVSWSDNSLLSTPDTVILISALNRRTHQRLLDPNRGPSQARYCPRSLYPCTCTVPFKRSFQREHYSLPTLSCESKARTRSQARKLFICFSERVAWLIPIVRASNEGSPRPRVARAQGMTRSSLAFLVCKR